MGSSAGKWTFSVVVVVLGAAWIVGILWLLHGLGPSPTAVHASAGAATAPLKRASITLQTFPETPSDAWMAEHHYHLSTSDIGSLDPHEDWVRYGPNTNIVVPAHALVTITIENYDGQSPLLNPFYSQVQGTLDGTMLADGKKVTGLDPSVVSHTFTIHSIPNSSQPWLYVSVPVLGLSDQAEENTSDNGFPPKPAVIQFTFQTGDPGTYIWQCFDPCGWTYNGFGGPMQTRGYMSGTFTVQG